MRLSAVAGLEVVGITGIDVAGKRSGALGDPLRVRAQPLDDDGAHADAAVVTTTGGMPSHFNREMGSRRT